MNAETEEEAAQELSATTVYKDSMEKTRMARVALLKTIGCSQLFAARLTDDWKFESKPFNLHQLVEQTAHSIEFIFNERRSGAIKINIEVEKETPTEVIGNEAMIYLMIMNIFKNTAKIMMERKTKKEDQQINVKLIERDGVLFIHYTDTAGGIDINGVIASAVERIVEVQSKTETEDEEAMPRTLRVISQGSWNMARQLTLQDICNLIFEGYISAREGGSGIGLSEGKEILNKHGAYIQVSPTRSKGTQFLIAFPLQDTSLEDLQRTIDQTKYELDQTENAHLGIKVNQSA
jgi:signal transduction histidine kinase